MFSEYAYFKYQNTYFTVCGNFEILAYSSMVLFSNVYYSSALSNVKEQEIIQTFESSANKIDHTITLMEQSAYNLAQHGLSLYLEHNKSHFEKAELKQN
ncbi:hypothetical protein [Pseudoalteromonas phenolica]|nr:hypothetical protein [Pseudoalteromonas phenolica]